MKTQILNKKATGATLLALIVSGSAFAQTQNNTPVNEDFSDNITYALCVLLFVIGFATLIYLKIREDKKHPKERMQQNNQNNQSQILHRNHYGQRHQYNH